MDALKASTAALGEYENTAAGASPPQDKLARQRGAALAQHQRALTAVQLAVGCDDIQSPRVKTMLTKKEEAIRARIASLAHNSE